MPYISYVKREALEPHIRALVNELKRNEEIDDGKVNYIITRLLRLTYGDIRYAILNRIIGVLECVKLEFYRRVLAPYEDTKKDKNGDVY